MSSRNLKTIRFAFFFLLLIVLFGIQLPGLMSPKVGAKVTLSPQVPSSVQATLICITGNIGSPDPMFNTLTSACAPPPTPVSVFYDAYGFNLTGCSGTGTVSASLCSVSCGALPTSPGNLKDSELYLYRNGGGTINPFNPASPTTNVVVCSDDAGGTCTAIGGSVGELSMLTSVLSNGHFVVVVSGNLASGTSIGNYLLTVTVTGGGCDLIKETPTAIALETFSSTSYQGGTLVEWQTGFETDNLGFNIYREQGGKRIQVSQQMVAGSALLTGQGSTLAAGRSYSWWDDAPRRSGVKYWLEEIDLSGQSKWHGPVLANRSANSDPPPGRGGARLLSSLTSSSRSSLSKPVERTASIALITPAKIAAQSSVASQPAVKLAVKQEGWYRLGQQDLLAAGVDPKTDPRDLQLFVDGREQAILVQGEEDGRLDSTDTVEFYGVGLDVPSTDSRTYWLTAGSQPGQRISQGKVKGKRESDTGFPYTVERRDRTVYVPSLKTEKYFGAVIAKNPTEQTINLPHVDVASAQQAKIDVALQGVTVVPHQVMVSLNDDPLGEIFFDGQAQGKTTFSVLQSRLRQGENKITLIPEAGDADISLVDTISVTYQRTYTADGDVLRFTALPKQKVSIGGFTSSAIRVVDITDPSQPQEITGKVAPQASGYAITIGAPKHGQRTLLAFADSQIKRVAATSANQPSNWRQPNNSADLLIISHRDFLNSVKPLVALRQSQGLSVAVADVEDVYDEFSYGHKTPQAIKDFLLYAKTEWQKAPRFVLLAGDATNDPRNFLGKGDFDFVPTKMIDTQYNATASDGWFADFADDGLSQIAIGRLAVRSAQEADTMIAKIVGYDPSSNTGDLLLVSDSNDGFDFEATSTQLRSLVPSTMRVDEIRRGQMETGAAKSSLIDSLNRGTRIVNYTGHGSVEMWRGGLLTPGDARGLSNSQPLPFVLAMTCLNGYFQDPVSDSLAEGLMKAERGGAVAVLASSGFTNAEPQAVMNKAMFTLMFGSDSMTVGEMVNRAKASVSDIDVRRTYTLFGDPSMKLR